MSWEQVWGAADLVVIDGETGIVYGKPAAKANLADDVYQWSGAPGVWNALGCPPDHVKTIAVAGWKPSSRVYGLGDDGIVYRYDGSPGAWTSIGGPSGGAAAELYGGPDRLLAVASGDPADVYRWDDDQDSWVRIGGPGKTFVVGRSSDPEFKLQVYGLSPDSAPAKDKGIYQWSGGWYQRGGPAGSVFVSRTTLFATDPVSGDLMSLYPTGWRKIGTPGAAFAVDQRGHIYGLSPDNAPADAKGVYAWEGTPNKWKKIGGPAKKLFAGWDRQVFATSPTTGVLMRYLGDVPAFAAPPDFAGTLVTEKMKKVLGKRRLAVMLWDPKRPDHPAPAKADIENTLFGPRPSLANWIQENSGGRCELINAGVQGWYDAPADKQGQHYWDNPDPASSDPVKRDPQYHQKKYHDGWLEGHGEKVSQAITKGASALAVADFNADNNTDLTADELAFVVGIPQEKAYGTWFGVLGKQYPHGEPLKLDGLTVPTAAEWYLGHTPDLGTAIHEVSHLLFGTPDMYFGSEWPYAAGHYSASDDAGPWHLSGPEKLKLGWLNYTVVTASGAYALQAVETSNEALVLYDPKHGPNEYFLIENRWRGTSYDAGGPATTGIPMDGIAIWHVIEDPAAFDRVDPFPPTGVKGEWGRLGVRMIRANGGVPFADHKALFDTKGEVVSDHTTPANLHWLDGSPSGFRVRLLSDAAATVQLDVLVTSP